MSVCVCLSSDIKLSFIIWQKGLVQEEDCTNGENNLSTLKIDIQAKASTLT